MDNELIVTKNWWNNNWKWFLPASLLLFLLLLGFILTSGNGGNITTIAQAYADDALYQKAIGELDALVHQKLLVLKGEAHAFKRSLADMDRLREYLNYLETGRDATLFLLSWHQ